MADLSRCLALVGEAVHLERQAKICDRLGGAPEAAQAYAKAAGELSEAAATCPLAPSAAQAATELAQAAERLAGTSAEKSVAKAIFLYRQAAGKALSAAAACPEPHPHRQALEQHAAEISVRLIYLESLNGAPATIPLEDHLGDLELEGGLPSGDAAEAAVAPAAACSPSGSFAAQGGLAPASAAAGAEEAAPGAEPGAKTDWMKEAATVESKGRDLEAEGRHGEAFKAYKDACHLFAFVLKRDERMKNPKIKEMVRARMEELLTKAEALKAFETLNS
mmetsp:Transcript_68385/g.154851  ORF Transcript_68385/g.154851 Transcript_68385/m.154851 type:complete len:278 (+) Transcript_68385:64-897(+)